MGRYVAKVLAAAEQDPEVARRFMRVAGLLDSPPALFAPTTVTRVVRGARASAAMAVAAPDDASASAFAAARSLSSTGGR